MRVVSSILVLSSCLVSACGPDLGTCEKEKAMAPIVYLDGTPYVEGYHPANAKVWVLSIIPFSLLGALIMTRIWHAKPTRGGAH